ncbi:MAG: hypothetical protein WC758_03350 [Candidatus Woesearchaeota archaeon]|jgi:hypothetical protein
MGNNDGIKSIGRIAFVLGMGTLYLLGTDYFNDQKEQRIHKKKLESNFSNIPEVRAIDSMYVARMASLDSIYFSQKNLMKNKYDLQRDSLKTIHWNNLESELSKWK